MKNLYGLVDGGGEGIGELLDMSKKSLETVHVHQPPIVTHFQYSLFTITKDKPLLHSPPMQNIPLVVEEPSLPENSTLLLEKCSTAALLGETYAVHK